MFDINNNNAIDLAPNLHPSLLPYFHYLHTMARKQASRLACSASTSEPRRSARLQPQQPEPPTTENQEIKQDPPPRISTRTQKDNKNDPTEEKENAPERQGRAPERRKLRVSKAKSLSRTRSSSSSGQKDTPVTKTDTVLEASTPAAVSSLTHSQGTGDLTDP